MFTREHMKAEVKGIEVQDALAMLHVIRRLVKAGVIEDVELAPIAAVRAKLVKQVQEATGVNFDLAVAKALAGSTQHRTAHTSAPKNKEAEAAAA